MVTQQILTAGVQDCFTVLNILICEFTAHPGKPLIFVALLTLHFSPILISIIILLDSYLTSVAMQYELNVK